MSDCEQLEIVFDLNALAATAVLQTIMDVIHKLGLPDEIKIALTHVEYKSVKYEKLLKQAKQKGHFSRFFTGKLSHDFGIVANWEHSFIHIREQERGAAKNWDEWLTPFINVPGFVQARVSDMEFDHWQNAEDFLEYECGGRDYSGLPLISNGLPPPLEQKVVDISGNPGRRIIKKGYIEAVGLRMWFGQVFWNLIGKKNPKQLEAAGWTITELPGGITYLETDKFHEGFSVEQQAALRSAIYGE